MISTCPEQVIFKILEKCYKTDNLEVYWVGVLWDSVRLHPSTNVPMHPK